MFWKRTKIWLQYAKRNRWQAVGFLLFGIIPLAIFHLLQRQIEVWEDAYLDKHGTSTAASAFVVVVDFIAHHPIWSIILFAVSVILGLLIHAYIATHPFHEYEKEVSHDRPEESGSPEGQKQRETHGKPVAGQLPEYRPLVIPAEYGRNSERSSYGLFIVNPGYTALEVHIPTVGVASSGYTLVFPPKLTQFGERDHKCFMEAWLEHPTLPGRDGGQLSNVMRTANIDSLNFVIRYKDLDSVWYKSNCRIELDVSLQSGLRVIFLGQALLGDNPEELQESPPSAEMIHAVNVELTPSQGQADRMYLEVENFGEKQTFHAQCRVLARRNDPNPQRLLTLDLGWVRNKARELEIRRGETCSLYVARAGQGRPSRDIEWIEIVGSPERVQSQWAIGQVTPLPEYDVEIVIFGGENQQPYSEKFTIRAGRECALEMFKLKADSEVWEDAGSGGPQLHLNWDYPPEARFGGFGTIRKVLQIENASPTDDAFKVAVDDVTLDVNSNVSASIEPISRLMRNSTVPALVVLKGQFLAEHQGEFEMVYYAAQQIPERMLEKTRSGERPQ